MAWRPREERGSFGDTIAAARERKGWSFTQEKVAELVGINHTYLSKIERNRVDPPSEATIRKLASILGADPLELLILSGKLPPGLQDRSKRRPACARLLHELASHELTDEHYTQLARSVRTLADEPPSNA